MVRRFWEREHASEDDLERGGNVTVKLTSFNSLKGKIALAVAGLVTVLTFGGATPAQAQVQGSSETLAVTDFTVRVPSSAVDLGASARDAVRGELVKAGKDVIAQDTVTRTMSDLGYVPPISRSADLVRLGQALGADFIVSGEVVTWQIAEVQGGKQAVAVIRVLMQDASSAITINGGALKGQSGVRSGDVSEATLLNEALADAGFHIVREMETRVLKTGTVLNTTPQAILIDKGTRSGYNQGQKVIIRRGREIVAEAVLTNVDPDSSFARVTRTYKGVQPSDKVLPVVDVPTTVALSNNGDVRIKNRKSSSGNSGLVQILLLLVVLGFLLGQGRGGSNTLIGNVQAEAIMQGNDVPGVRVSWVRDAFLRGINEGPVMWQVHRGGFAAGPVVVADGTLYERLWLTLVRLARGNR